MSNHTVNGLTAEDWQKIASAKDEAVTAAVSAIDELADAIRLTVEYVGTDTLPPVEGWSWYDALMKHRPEIAEQFVWLPAEPDADRACSGKVGVRPDWMGADQWDGPCPCILIAGHDGVCRCDHMTS
jgi:hypothetical protein